MKTKVPLTRPSIWNPKSSLTARLIVPPAKMPKGWLSATVTLTCGWFDRAGWVYGVELEAWRTDWEQRKKDGLMIKHVGSGLYFFRKGNLRDGCMCAAEQAAAELFHSTTGGHLYAHDFKPWTIKKRY